MKKIVIATAAAILLVLTATLLVTGCFGTFNPNPSPFPTATPSPTPTPPPTLIVPDDCPTISSAIANAKDGYWIIVKNGTYNEQTLNINKTLTIISQDQNGAQIILNPLKKEHYGPYEYRYESALQIYSNDVTLSGFLIAVRMPPNGQTLGDEIGLILVKADRVKILNNNLLGKEKISFVMSGNASKVASNSLGSISVNGLSNLVENNQIAGKASISGEFNSFNKNNVSTIWLSGSNNTITSNQVIGGDVGINLQPDYHYKPINFNIIWNNTIIVNHSSDSIGIKIDFGDTISKRTDYNFFGGNTICQAQASGILFKRGTYNVFYGNIVRDCTLNDYFVERFDKDQFPVCNNLFFGNSFMNNSKVVTNCQVRDSNFFDNDSMGNYWDTYSGTGAFQVYNTTSAVYFDNFPLLESPGVLTDFPSLPSPWNKISLTLSNS